MALNTDDGSQPPLSFKGRIKMEDFSYKATANTTAANCSAQNVRRSTGASTSLSSPSSASTTPRTKRPASPRPTTPSKRNEASPSDRSKPRRKRPKTGYAPPSTYAHLPLLRDAIGPHMLVLFVGLNPGLRTAESGHAYAHPTNLFWRLLHSSGCTPHLCAAEDDQALPARHCLGLTNIVTRPSRNNAELSKAEMDAGVAVLEEKVRRWQPEVVCIVGKGIWESVWRVRRGRGIRSCEFAYGWQSEGENMGVVTRDKQVGSAWGGAKVFVATSTSGLAATLKPQEKESIWRELGVWVEGRRKERLVADETMSA